MPLNFPATAGFRSRTNIRATWITGVGSRRQLRPDKRLSPPPSEVHSPFCRAPWFHSSRLPLPRLGTGTPLPQRLMGVSYPRLARLSRGKIKLFWESCRKPFSEQAGPFKNPFWEEHRLTELQMHPFHWLGQHPCACGRFGIEKNGRYRSGLFPVQRTIEKKDLLL